MRRVAAAAVWLGVLVAFAATTDTAVASGAASKPKRKNSPSIQVYKWVDENGVTHYGDAVPPQYAAIDRDVINQYGVQVRTEQGQLSPEEIEAQKRAEAERIARAQAARRDEVLLSTYLSVEEIEALRNRRVELMEGQIKVTRNYLGVLKTKLGDLKKEASGFRPYSSDPEAPPIEDALQRELSDTIDSISLYEKTLADTRTKQTRLVAQFDADIARFRELRRP